MDQGTLVEMQIKDGQFFIERLIEEDVPVTAAGWVKESESERWYLYLVTPLVGEHTGKKPAYRRINEVFRRLSQPLWVEHWDVNVVGPDSRVGEALCELQRTYPGPRSLRYAGPRLGDMYIDGVYVYPPLPAPVS